MMIEIRKLKDELHEAEQARLELNEKFMMVQDSAKAIGMLKEQLFQRDETIQQLRMDYGNLQGEAYESTRQIASIQTELQSRIE